MIGRYLERRSAMVFDYRLTRLRKFGVLEAIVLIVANRVCGTPMYWYPKAKRAQLRAARTASA